jgi:hypothetical protein
MASNITERATADSIGNGAEQRIICGGDMGAAVFIDVVIDTDFRRKRRFQTSLVS